MTNVQTEAHLHTSEVSGCAHVPAARMLACCAQAGYGAAIITDHFLPGLFETRSARERYLTGYRNACAWGADNQFTVLLGMEFRFDRGAEDFLIYGVREEQLFRLPRDVCSWPLRDFHALCADNGWLLYQAHPFRPVLRVQDARYLDGIEVLNGNPRHNSHNDEALAFARANRLLMVRGSDAHEYGDVGAACLHVPRELLTPEGIVAYLRTLHTPDAFDAYLPNQSGA